MPTYSHNDSAPIPGHAAFGKLQRGDDGQVTAWLPLLDHMRDVAAVFAALLVLPSVRHSLERLAHRQLTPVDEARLCALVFLHDLGKANSGFQAKRWLDVARPRAWPIPAGHTAEVFALLEQPRAETVLPLEALDNWGDATGSLLRASISHHGRPVEPLAAHYPQIWKPVQDGPNQHIYDPWVSLGAIGDAVQASFPAAFNTASAPLPDEPAFGHFFAGLVQLADWIGSDTRFFSYGWGTADRPSDLSAKAAIDALGLDVEPWRQAMQADPPDFQRCFQVPAPRPMQAALGQIPDEPIVLLEAETGSGKTEAALWHFLKLFEQGLVDSLYFALPTRVAASQVFERVCRFVEQGFKAPAPVCVRALPGYVNADGADQVKLADFRVLWTDKPDDALAYRRWAAEAPKRFLAATIAVGTIDQALLSGLSTSHAHLRHACLARSLLVVDEVHASDTYMTSVLEHVLAAHVRLGGRALLLSATLGAVARVRYMQLATQAPGKKAVSSLAVPDLSAAAQTPYPLISHGRQQQPVAGAQRSKHLAWHTWDAIDDPARIAELAMLAAREGARILIVRNTVPAAIATQLALETLATDQASQAILFSVQGHPTVHHSRYAAVDRPLLDAAVEARLGKHRASTHGATWGTIVVGTQTLEQSLDLDADLLITDLCPMDVLLQRIGRLHRHVRPDDERPAAYRQAQAIVLTPSGHSLERYLGQPQHGLGRFRNGGGVYTDLRMLEATRRLIDAAPSRDIPADNRALVEHATHPQALAAIEQAMGDAWVKLGQQLTGEDSAASTLGRLHALPFATDFESLQFPDGSERIATRLGAADRRIEFDPPVRTPFGNTMHCLNLRAHLLPSDAATDAQPCDVQADDDAIQFSLGSARYRYSRLGLERLSPTDASPTQASKLTHPQNRRT